MDLLFDVIEEQEAEVTLFRSGQSPVLLKDKAKIPKVSFIYLFIFFWWWDINLYFFI
jgi:hypothetical protein